MDSASSISTACLILKLFDGTDPDLNEDLLAGIQDLLIRKAETEEKDLNSQMPIIIDFIKQECENQKRISDAAPDDHNHDYAELNEVFRQVMKDDRGWIPLLSVGEPCLADEGGAGQVFDQAF